MKYLKRYNKFSFQTNCRICLTQSVSKMIALDAPLKGITTQRPLVYEAMEFVMSEKINLNEQYPCAVCAVCIELLRISYDLKIQYRQTLKKLKEQLGEQSESQGEAESEEDKPLVEILVGSKKFNIHDVLIVEEDDQSDEKFDGFLKNLGKSITASFVKKGYENPKPVLEVPALIIEKVTQAPRTTIGIKDNSQFQSKDNIRTENIEDADDGQSDEQEAAADDSEPDDNMFIDTPVNEDLIKTFVTSTENEKEALQSAMNFKYKCPYCEKPMSSLNRVKLHTSRNCKKNNSNSRCYVCGVTFEGRRQLLLHLKQVHFVKIKKAHETKEEEKLKCDICGKVCQSHGSLSYHMNKHSGRRYGCDLCDKRSYTRSQAANHRQSHNREDTLVVCPICGKGFHYQNGLFYHMKIHTNERKYQCSYCPRRFYTRNSIKRHELTHTGARPYACNFCDKKFRSLGEVKKHNLLHTGERPYHCKYCTLGFTSKFNLKMHLMRHPGDFACMHCSKTFAEKDTLIFHLQNKHGVGKDTQNEEEFNSEEETENVEQEEQMGQDPEAIEEPEEIIDDEVFITEEYIDYEGQPIVQTYEVGEVLVETVEEHLQ